MEKSKLNSIAIIVLIVLNICTLGFIFFNSSKNHRPPMDRMNPKDIIIKKLHLDESQQKDFTKLIEWHQSEIQKHDKEIVNAKKSLYGLLTNNEIDLKSKDSLITVINLNQKQIEETHFKHFEDIKKLCKPEQLDDFKEFSKELGRLFAPNKQRKEKRESERPKP
jgi:Spy/CpxP family protein refolding chaperone